MSNGNIITKTLATIGGARLALNATGVAHRAYLTKRIGTEYTTWRDAFQGRRTTRTIRDARSLAMLCDRHGLTDTAVFYHWIAGTLEKLNSRTPQADLHTATRNFQRIQEQINRDYL